MMQTKGPIVLDTLVAQTNDLVSSDLDGETVLLSIETGKYYNMDPIGSRIWGLIKDPLSVLQLIDILLDEFNVDREQCEKEVLVFLDQLAGDHLIRVADEPAE